jgi:hypothetical protein
VTPVTDIRVHRKDLVLSTMGRSFWIMDNITPLQQIAEYLAKAPAGGAPAGTPTPGLLAPGARLKTGVLTPREAYRMRSAGMGGRPDQPEYPAPGAHIDYFVGTEPVGDITIEIQDSAGNLIRSFSTAGTAPPVPAEPRAQDPDAALPRRGVSVPPRLVNTPGMHRLVWDLRHGAAGDPAIGGGPLAVPGKYQVRLKVANFTEIKPLELRLDPRVVADGVTQADLQEQLDFCLQLGRTMTEARQLAGRIVQARERLAKQGGQDALVKKLAALEAKMVTAGGAYPQPMLLDQLSATSRQGCGADQKIGRAVLQFYDELKKQLAAIAAEAGTYESKQ